MVHIGADKDEFLPAVSPWFLHAFADRSDIVWVFRPLVLVDRCKPVSIVFDLDRDAGLGPSEGLIVPRCDPAVAFGSQDTLEDSVLKVQGLHQAIGVKRTAFFEGKGGDSVFIGLGDFLSASDGEPIGVPCCPLFVVGFRADDLIDRDATELGAKDFCEGIEFFDEGLDRVEFGGFDQVAFVQEDHGSEFDLIDQQIDNIALVLVIDPDVSFFQIVERLVILPKV